MALSLSMEVSGLIESLVDENQKLNYILQEDINHFKASDFQAMEESNQQKESIQQTIWDILQSINTHRALENYSGNYIAKILAYCESLPEKECNKTKQLVEKAESLWNEGYQLVKTNSAIVDANLNYARDLISHIIKKTEASKQGVDTYDQAANISSK